MPKHEHRTIVLPFDFIKLARSIVERADRDLVMATDESAALRCLLVALRDADGPDGTHTTLGCICVLTWTVEHVDCRRERGEAVLAGGKIYTVEAPGVATRFEAEDIPF